MTDDVGNAPCTATKIESGWPLALASGTPSLSLSTSCVTRGREITAFPYCSILRAQLRIATGNTSTNRAIGRMRPSRTQQLESEHAGQDETDAEDAQNVR